MALHLTGSIVVSDSITSTSAEIIGSLGVTGSVGFTGSLNVDGNVGFSAPITSAAGWSTGGNMITSRNNSAGAGTQNAGLTFGGQIGSGFGATYSDNTEEYNGSSFATGGVLSCGRSLWGSGIGTQNAALATGGEAAYTGELTCTEEYDGTSWAAGGALTTKQGRAGGAGTQNAGLLFGGAGVSNCTLCTQEYNGSTWSTGGNLISALSKMGGSGTQNAGLAVGGEDSGGVIACTEEYNGASWSAGGALITARYELGVAGIQNNTMAAAGFSSTGNVSSTATELYDGTSWSTSTATPSGGEAFAAAGDGTAGLLMGINGTATTLEFGTGAETLTETFNYSTATGNTTIIPPTSDPAIAGALWNNGVTLAISAG